MDPDRLLNLDLRHLRALQAVAEEGSFNKAAVRLGYTQSAVSQQIQTLEKIVGDKLVERPGGPRPVYMTEAGSVLLVHANAIVARLRAAQADLALLSDGTAGTLRVGTYQSVGTRILPELMRRYHQACPHITVQLTEAEDDALFELLEQGEVDLSFVAMPLAEGPFEGVELARDPYVLVVPEGHPLAGTSGIPTRRDLSELPMIGFRTCRAANHLENALRMRGIEPQVIFRSDDNGTVQAMVAAGMGVAMMPLLAVGGDRRTQTVDLGPRVPPRVIAIAWHRDRVRSGAAQEFVALAGQVCEDLSLALPEVVAHSVTVSAV